MYAGSDGNFCAQRRSSFSRSIDVYRPQAAFSDGGYDGKIGAPQQEFFVFQMLMSAGDN
jgi:hypothetical protein